jgi:hypothetical protein
MGTGVIFDMGTVLTMLIVSVVVGAFVLWKVWTYSNEERTMLYKKLGVCALITNNICVYRNTSLKRTVA